MNRIKGLMLKDLLQLKSYKKTLIVFIVIFIITSMAEQANFANMLIIMMTLGFGMFSMATFSYDELNHADRYLLTLPLTKKEIVLAKYFFIIIATILGSVFGILLAALVCFVTRQPMLELTELLPIASAGLLGIALVEAIQIPCVYKWGAEKGRIQMFVLVAIVAFGIGGILFLLEKMNWDVSGFLSGEKFQSMIPILMIIGSIVLYFLSYHITCKIYERKEI